MALGHPAPANPPVADGCSSLAVAGGAASAAREWLTVAGLGRDAAAEHIGERARQRAERRRDHGTPSIAARIGTSIARTSVGVAGSRIVALSLSSAACSAERVSSFIAAPLILVPGLARFGEELQGAAVGDFLLDPPHEGPKVP